MATIDEVLAAMPDAAAEAAYEYLTIDPATRRIIVPEAEEIFGVESDTQAARKYFQCPRYVGDNVDLAACFLRVNFRNANGDVDAYLVQDAAVSGDLIVFSWELSRKVTQYKGQIQFVVCACYPHTGGSMATEWNTTVAVGTVLEGLEPDSSTVEAETADVVTQLLAEVAAQTDAVEACGAAQVKAVEAAAAESTADAQAQIEAKGVATLATIPEDYSTMAGKVNEQANAIKGSLSGEIVQAGDVSPVEHFLGVKVRSANLLPTPYHHMTNEVNGVLWVAQEDGGIVATGTPENSSNIKLYQGDALVVSGYVTLSVSGATNARIAIALIDESDTVVFNTQAGQITVNVDDYPTAKRWIVRLYSITDGVEMAETIYPKIETGPVATEYTPYIDPVGVTVTRCGKNLFDVAHHKFVSEHVTINSEAGSTYDVTGEIGNTSMAYSAGAVRIKLSQAVHITGKITVSLYLTLLEQGAYDNRVRMWAHDGAKSLQYTTAELTVGVRQKVTLVCDTVGETLASILLYINNNRLSIEAGTLQIEKGDAATAYEPYNGAAAMPAADGTVGGLTSLAPTMTLLTDTAGVNIECIYNRDTNAVLAEILEKIAALSG